MASRAHAAVLTLIVHEVVERLLVEFFFLKYPVRVIVLSLGQPSAKEQHLLRQTDRLEQVNLVLSRGAVARLGAKMVRILPDLWIL